MSKELAINNQERQGATTAAEMVNATRLDAMAESLATNEVGPENWRERIAEQIKPSVVHIQSYVEVKDLVNPDKPETTHKPVDLPAGSGTGFFFREDGHIMTNAHVVDRGGKFVVTLSDGRKVAARVIDPGLRLGHDDTMLHNPIRLRDVAVLKIDGAGYPPLKIAKPEETKQGQEVLIAGNPLSKKGFVGEGIVGQLPTVKGPTAAGRIDTFDGYIAITAQGQPGISGGPLVNNKGEVMGIVSGAEISPAGSGAITHAVPGHEIAALADNLEFFLEIRGLFRHINEALQSGGERRGMSLSDAVDEVIKGFKSTFKALYGDLPFQEQQERLQALFSDTEIRFHFQTLYAKARQNAGVYQRKIDALAEGKWLTEKKKK